jgi:hypothetical protein
MKDRIYRQQKRQHIQAVGKARYPGSGKGRAFMEHEKNKIYRQQERQDIQAAGQARRISRQRERQDIHAAERQGIQAVVKAGHSGSRKGRISRQQERQDI